MTKIEAKQAVSPADLLKAAVAGKPDSQPDGGTAAPEAAAKRAPRPALKTNRAQVRPGPLRGARARRARVQSLIARLGTLY